VVYANSNLGTLLLDERRYQQAARAFEDAVRPAERLAAAEPDNVDYQKQVAGTLAWLADAHEFAGELDQALAERERQLDDFANGDEKDECKLVKEINISIVCFSACVGGRRPRAG